MLDRGATSPMAPAFDDLLAGGALTVAFQPVVDITLGETFGFEVLGRVGTLPSGLSHVEPGPLSLLEAAHSCGRLLALDRRWRTLAIEAIAAQPDQRALYFINVDPRVVEDPAHEAGFTRELVRRHGLDPRRFVLELTEARTIETSAIERVMAQYRDEGFAIALDDLGAPPQSLGLLLRLRPDYVKLDANLVRGIEGDPLRQHLLHSLVAFADRTKLALVVEGIETEAELREVREAGAHLVQGFLLGTPDSAPLPLGPRAASGLRAAHGAAAGRRAGVSDDGLVGVARLVEAMGSVKSLEGALQHVAAFASALLGVERVSVRLLDESRGRLLVAGRAGSSLHASENVDFAVGEGLVGWVVAKRTSLRLRDADRDPRFATKPGMQEPMGAFLGVPLLDDAGCIGVIATSSQEPGGFGLEHERRLRLVASVVSPQLQVARLRRLAMSDPLTGVWNRRGLDEILGDGRPTSMMPVVFVAVDVDRFKSINDRHGHAAGDEVLRLVACALARSLRETDHVIRVGGDEFVLVLVGATLDQARDIAERARREVLRVGEGREGAITVSMGVARLGSSEATDDAIARADASLYRAKERGRNRVEADIS